MASLGAVASPGRAVASLGGVVPKLHWMRAVATAKAESGGPAAAAKNLPPLGPPRLIQNRNLGLQKLYKMGALLSHLKSNDL